ncbi:MAG TPA: hypothetical protein VFG23_12885 [Polyangia bacterium]|nr:hypothetical protein [Polyangia bacterium]
MSNILLRLTGNADDAKAVLDDTAAEVDAFGKKRATAEIRVDATRAKADIAEVVAELKAIPREETIRIRVAGEQAKLQGLMARKAGLENQLQNTASAGGDTGPLIQRLGSVSSQIEAVRGRITGLASDFERAGSDGERGFSRVTNALTKVDRGIADVVGHVPLLGGLMKGAINGVSSGLQSIVGMLPEAVQGFGGMLAAGLSLAAVGPIVLLIVGALAALVVSLGMALIGVVALGVAFLAALAPIALVLGAIALKFKAAYTAQQNLVAATNAQKSAVVALAQAQYNESNQRIAALAAEKSAVLALRDAENGVADAKLGVKSSALAITQAQLALAEFKRGLAGMGTSPGGLDKAAGNVSVGGNLGQTQQGGDPNAWKTMLLQYRTLVLAVTQAEQAHRDAIAGVADATNTLSKAQTTSNQFAQSGLRAYAPYASALSSAATAANSLSTANHNLSLDARKMAASDGILGIFSKLRATFNTLFGPAVNAAIGGLGKALGILAKGLAPLSGPMKTLGVAIGKGFVQLAKDLTSKTAIADFKKLINGAAKLVPVLIGFFAGLGGVLVGVANAAMPALTSGLGKLGKKFEDVAKHPKKIKEFIDKCLSQTKDWLGWIGKVLGVVGHLAGLFSSFGPILKGFVMALKPVFWALTKINTALGALEATAHANDKATASHVVNNEAQASLVKRLQAELKGPLSASLRARIQMTLAGLASTKADLAQGQWNHMLDTTKFPHPPAAGGTTQHITVQMNQGDQVGDPNHFARVLKKNFANLGGGVR